MERRGFVLTLAGLAGGCASLVTTPVTPVAGTVRLRLDEWPALAEPGGSARLRLAGSGELVYVLALDDGAFAALSPVCKHRGCTVEIELDRLRCPCHGSQYGRDGRVLRGPTQRPLDRYDVSLNSDGSVLTIQVGG